MRFVTRVLLVSATLLTILVLGVVLLAVMCFAWGVVALVLYPLLPAKTGRKVGRVGAMWVFRSYLAAMEAIGA